MFRAETPKNGMTRYSTRKSVLRTTERCSVDPQLFQNFKTEDGDQLRAEFRAFKFPESNFVLFKGMVNVCLDWCTAVKCANGEVGYGKRRRRDVSDDEASRINKIYEVSMATIVKVAEEPVEGKPADLWLEKATLQEVLHPDDAAIAALSEEFGAYKYIDFQSSSSSLSASVGLVFLIGLLHHIMAF
ncbi:hypothetical protein TCAL_08637 [Tigriopus californicus]|uniref:ZP domain-containing protein n=1 Tax=Tigriopus californicus TaxID=6832 RepID=A0A553NU89_TIGCA|nr:hypothetical protein TCAL_08637 [Tigriopus californicus]